MFRFGTTLSKTKPTGQVTAGEPVILLHGLWLYGAAMGFLSDRLREHGFAPHNFDHSTTRDGLGIAGDHLRRRIAGFDGQRVHLVGHSLGGLLAAMVVQANPDLCIGRIVCLGSPLRGSAAARSLLGFPGGGSLLGRSAELLERGLEQWNAPQSIGAIAGQLPFGLGFMLGGVSAPHDGTVSVAETRLPGITDHRVVSAAHTGLVFSREVAQLTATFLRDGCFGSEQKAA